MVNTKDKQKIDNLEALYCFPQTIFAPPPNTIVARGLSQICLNNTTKMLGSTNNNSEE